MLKSGFAVLSLLLLAGCAVSNPVVDSSTATPSSPDAVVANPTDAASPGTPDSTATVGDLQVIPGDRFGPITATTTRDDLVQRFGESQLVDKEIGIGEGETEPGTVVNLGETQSFTVVWTDSNRTKIDHIRNPGTAWKTPQGIGIGTTFDTLQQELGDFQLYGFAWDYGGTIELENSKLAAYQDLLILRVQPSESAIANASAQYEAVMGDALFPSGDPNLAPLNLRVEEMLVFLEPRS